jgi:hypothetical protein
MLARKKRAKLAREKKRLELLKNPPQPQAARRKIKQRDFKEPLIPRYTHRSSCDIINRPEQTEHNTYALERLQYTGTRLLGIAVLHKSCLQPVFSQEEAEAAAKMRRN